MSQMENPSRPLHLFSRRMMLSLKECHQSTGQDLNPTNKHDVINRIVSHE